MGNAAGRAAGSVIHSNVMLETASTVDGVGRSTCSCRGHSANLTNHPMITKGIHCLNGMACVKFSVMIPLSPNAFFHG